MQLVNWILLFLATLFGYLDSMKATSLSQDTIRDEAYQLYPLGIACRNNVCICFMFLDNTCGKREMGSYVYCAVDVRVVLWLLPIY